MAPIKSTHGSTYRIRLQGAMDLTTIDWFGGITVLPQEPGETLLVGQFPDQAALRGFLDHLWNLNFTILSVERIKNQKDQVPR